MAHFYVVRQKIDKTKEEEKILYYGVPVTSGHISTHKLAEYIADRCSLSKGDVLAAICELGDQIKERLSEGYTVDLENWGSFYLSAGSEGYENPKDCTPHRVKARRICFKMSPSVRKELKYFKFQRKPEL